MIEVGLFDPFFTTKDVGGGTALGLSICHGIVTSLGGQITIESTPGLGSAVHLMLPAAADESGTATSTRATSVPSALRLHVLVVDDDRRVVEMTARVLARDHTVTIALCGKDALDHVAKGAWFDVIVSDVMMPNMTGIELFEELARVAPAQAKRVVFLTGGAFTEETRARLDELGTPVLEKPVSTAELRQRVAELGATGRTT